MSTPSEIYSYIVNVVSDQMEAYQKEIKSLKKQIKNYEKRFDMYDQQLEQMSEDISDIKQFNISVETNMDQDLDTLAKEYGIEECVEVDDGDCKPWNENDSVKRIVLDDELDYIRKEIEASKRLTYTISSTDMRALEKVYIGHDYHIGVGSLSRFLNIYIDERWKEMPVRFCDIYNEDEYIEFDFQDKTITSWKNPGAYVYWGSENPNDYLAKHGNLEELERLYSDGKTCSDDAIGWAAMNGHLEVVKFLYSTGMTKVDIAFELAKKNNHTEIVKFLREHYDNEYAMKIFRESTNNLNYHLKRLIKLRIDDQYLNVHTLRPIRKLPKNDKEFVFCTSGLAVKRDQIPLY